MKSDTTDYLLEKYITNIGTYYFYNQYIIAEIIEGAKVNLEQTNKLIPLINKHYGNEKSFGYISNRINSYAISPLNHLQCPGIDMPNFKGFAVVTYTTTSTINVEIEKRFVKIPFKQFNSVAEASNG
ncbi:hypothetical protein [Aquimarina sp. 2304DJ70-9]|uniref:hypothetical protein n=1 Tax=Aquimarina penaris TaxID=3231044 RepID=UPI0034621C19